MNKRFSPRLRASSFSAADEEAGLSRIYAGQHFHTDHLAGQKLGRAVAGFDLRGFRQPFGDR